MLAQDGSALVPARATDTPSSPAQVKGAGGGKEGCARVDGNAWILAPSTDATYFVACFICTIKRRPIRLSYSLSGDFRPDGIFHQTFTLACLFARVAFRIPIKTWQFYARATKSFVH